METVVLKLTPQTQFTNEELFKLCVANPEFRIERNENKELIIMSPVGALGSSLNNTVSSILWLWNQQHKLGITFDSSGGFLLNDNSIRAADAAFIFSEAWQKLEEEEKEKFPRITPDFVIEIRSKTDALPELQLKMTQWISNGCKLAWLIDPIKQKAYVYRHSGLVKTASSFNEKLYGDDLLPGFELDLALLK